MVHHRHLNLFLLHILQHFEIVFVQKGGSFSRQVGPLEVGELIRNILELVKWKVPAFFRPMGVFTMDAPLIAYGGCLYLNGGGIPGHVREFSDERSDDGEKKPRCAFPSGNQRFTVKVSGRRS